MLYVRQLELATFYLGLVIHDNLNLRDMRGLIPVERTHSSHYNHFQ